MNKAGRVKWLCLYYLTFLKTGPAWVLRKRGLISGLCPLSMGRMAGCREYIRRFLFKADR